MVSGNSYSRNLTTHSTGARVSRSFIVNLNLSAVRRARLIRALGRLRNVILIQSADNYGI
jgi:hypothetical protein